MPSPSEWQGLLEDAGVGWAAADLAKEAWKTLEADVAAVEAVLAPLGSRWFSGDLAREMLADPEELRPFVQTFAAAMTPNMRALAYLMLRGARLVALRFEYRFQESSFLEARVDLGGPEPLVLSSEEFWDAEVLRHLGLLKVSGRPVMEGYYALRK